MHSLLALFQGGAIYFGVLTIKEFDFVILAFLKTAENSWPLRRVQQREGKAELVESRALVF